MSDADITEVLRILPLHRRYVLDMGQQLAPAWALPHRYHRLIVEPGLAFTWMRRLGPLMRAPVEDDWRGDDGDLWVVDMIADPDVLTPRDIGRRVGSALVERGVAAEGEPVLFWRYKARRYGRFIARGSYGQSVQSRL